MRLFLADAVGRRTQDVASAPTSRITIQIAYVVDANYGPYAGISIASVVRHFRGERLVTLHFQSVVGRERRDIERIRHVMRKSNVPH